MRLARPSAPRGSGSVAFDPLDGIRLAVHRTLAGGPPVHDQVLSMVQTWRAYTKTPTDIAGDERLGRLEVGARGDIIMLDGDPFASYPDLLATVVCATMVDGRLIHGEAEVRG